MREKLESGGLPEALEPHIRINEIVHLGVCKDRGGG
jgi:hypothetical protein